MSTRSRIGIVNADGTVTHVYCHYDGYPSHHAPILLGAYDTEEKVRELLAMGSISVLDRSIGEAQGPYDVRPEGWCSFHGRDYRSSHMPAETTAPEEFLAAAVGSDAEWVYLFAEGTWRYAPQHKMPNRNGWSFLSQHRGER